MTLNPNIGGALYWHGREQYAKKTVHSYLNRLLAEAGFDPRKDGIRLSVENSPYTDDFEKPRLFLTTVLHSPTVSIQFESENATPEEIQRLVPYLKSIPALWERDMLKEAGFQEPTTAKDVALPYDGEATSIVLFVDSFIVGRLPFDLTFEEAVDRARTAGGAR